MPEQIGVEVVAVGVAAFSRALRTAQDDLERFQGAINTSANAATTLGTNLLTIGGNMERLGRSMTIGITAPLGILTGTLLSAGIEFEKSFVGISKTVEGVAVGFDEIKIAAQQKLGITITTMDEAKAAAKEMGMAFGDLTPLGEEVQQKFREMALTIPLPAAELNKFGEIAGQMGVEVDSIDKFTRSIAYLDIATEVAGEDAAKMILQIKNITGNALSAEEYTTRLGSAIVYLGNETVASEGQILNLSTRIAAAGALVKITDQEMLAWATTIAEVGGKNEAAGTALSRVFDNMMLAVAEGGDKLQLFADVVGVSAEEMTRMFKDDASNAVKIFLANLRPAVETGKIGADVLTDLGIGGVRAMDNLLRLSGATELFDKNLQMSNEAWAEGIALQEEAEKASASIAAQIQLTKNAFGDLGIELKILLQDDIKKLLEKIREGIGWFKNLDKGILRTILKFAGIVAAIGPVLVVLGALISTVGTILTAIGGFPAALKLVSRTLLGTLGPVGLLISGLLLLIPLLSGAGFKLNVDFSGVTAQFNNLVGIAKTSVGKIGLAFANLKIGDTGVVESLQKLLDTLVQGIVDKATKVIIFVQDVVKGFTDAFIPFITDKGPQIERILGNFKTIVDNVREAFEKVGTAIATALGLDTSGTGVGEFLGTLAGLAFEGLLDSLETASGFVANLADNFAKIAESQTVKDIISGIAAAFLQIKDAAAGVSTTWIAGIAGGFQNIMGAVENSATLQSFVSLMKTLFDMISNFAWQWLNDSINNLKDATKGFIDGIMPFIQAQGPRLQQIWENLATVWERLGPLFDAINRLAQAFGNLGMAAGIDTDWETIGQFFGFLAGLVLDEIIRGIEWFTRALIDSVTIMTILVNLGTRFVTFFQEAGRSINQAAANMGSAIRNALGPVASLFDSVRNSVDRIKETFWGVQNTINSVMWSFDMLQWKIGNVVNTSKWYLDQLGAKVQDVLRMITGSPELVIQHPFEKFETYLKTVDFSKLIEGSMALNSMNQISMVAPAGANSQTNVTNNRQIQANISGVPLDTANGIVDILQRQTRMSEVFQQ